MAPAVLRCWLYNSRHGSRSADPQRHRGAGAGVCSRAGLMEPQIHYVRTTGGVPIAYYEMCEGQPFVWMDMLYSHIQRYDFTCGLPGLLMPFLSTCSTFERRSDA